MDKPFGWIEKGGNLTTLREHYDIYRQEMLEDVLETAKEIMSEMIKNALSPSNRSLQKLQDIMAKITDLENHARDVGRHILGDSGYSDEKISEVIGNLLNL